LLEKLDNQRWFNFQPVVLEYVRYKAGEQTEVHQRAISFYLLNAKQKPWQTLEDIKEYLEVFYHWYQLKQYGSAFDILNACNDFLSLRGYYTVQVELGDQLIAAWEKTGERENWKYQATLANLGNAYQSLGQYQQAIKFHQQWLNIAREIGDRFGEGGALGNIGNAHQSLGQYQRAIDFHQQWLNIAREIGNRNGEGSALGGIGLAYQSLGQYQQAIEFQQQWLNIAREIGDRNGEGSALGNIGNAHQSLGQYQQAIDFHQQSLNLARELGNRFGEGSALGNIGNAHQSLGQYQQAIDFHQQSLNLAREIGDRDGEARAWFNLGLALENVNRESDAIGAYRNALKLWQAMGLDANVQGCNKAIERLLQKNVRITTRQGFWVWVSNLWRLSKKLWRRILRKLGG
jgi:tetratricopeptide (TPR) repeat protein